MNNWPMNRWIWLYIEEEVDDKGEMGQMGTVLGTRVLGIDGGRESEESFKGK